MRRYDQKGCGLEPEFMSFRHIDDGVDPLDCRIDQTPIAGTVIGSISLLDSQEEPCSPIVLTPYIITQDFFLL